MKKLSILLFVIVVMVSCNTSEKKKIMSDTRVSEVIIEEQNPELAKSIVKGKAIYSDFCMSCHMPNGKGIPKAFPPLANSDYLRTNRVKSIKAVKYGQSGKITVNGQIYNSAMAPLGLEDDEIADVMNYITNSWGNSNDKLITVKEVSEIKE